MEKKLVNYISILMLFGFCTGCKEQKSVEQGTPAVIVAQVVKEAITKSSDFVGKTEAIEQVELRARVEGFLEKQSFISGGDVKAGDILFLIEKPPYQVEVDREKAGVAKAEADLALAKVSLLRMEELKKKQTVSQSELDKAIADEKAALAFVEAAKAELAKAQLNLDYTNIVAPISGKIDRAAYDVGNLVGPSSGVMATINKMDPIYVNFSLSEVDFMEFKRFKIEQEKSQKQLDVDSLFTPFIILPDGSEYPHEGNINFVDNKIDQATGTILLRCDFPNPDKLLLPGQFVRVLVKLKKDKMAIVVPQVAVISQQAGHSVLVVDSQGIVASRRITLGEKHGVKWVVKNGLEEGEWVITEGIQKVRPGIRVDATRNAQAESLSSIEAKPQYQPDAKQKGHSDMEERGAKDKAKSIKTEADAGANS